LANVTHFFMSKLKINSRYGVIPQSVLYSRTLSLKAKGLFGYMQSKPDGWDFSADRIALECKEAREAIQSALHELECAGLLTRTKYKDERGQWQWQHELSENPSTENPTTDEPTTENPTIKQEVDSKKYEVRNTPRSRASKEPTYNALGAEIIKAFEPLNLGAKRWYANTTQRQACDDLLAAHDLQHILQVIALLPDTNKMPYMPTITTPLQLRDKWTALGDAIHREREKTHATNEKYKVAFT